MSIGYFKRILHDLIKQDRHGFACTVNELVGFYTSSFLEDLNIPFVNDSLKSYKTSDKIFVKGSRQIINQIDPIDFSYISENDSIGFNYWFIHDHIPPYMSIHDHIWMAINMIIWVYLFIYGPM